ncbi:hypothetical protein ACH4MU_15565 [Streptomyces albidoflavus]
MSDGLPSDPFGEQYRGLLLTTNMISHGIDRSRVGMLHSAIVRLRDLMDLPWTVIEPGTSSIRSEGRDIARDLLRTAEEALGFPCSTSGLLRRQEPTSATGVPVVADGQHQGGAVLLDGQHRITHLKSVVRLTTGTGKTAAMALTLVDQLSQRIGRVNRDGRRPTPADLGGIADAAQALSALLLLLAQRLLTGCFEFRGEAVSVPPTASSPCGLLRLAAPRVPRAPGSTQVPDPTGFFALAA